MLLLWLLVANLISVTKTLEKNKIIIVILSQDVEYYDKKATILKNNILKNSHIMKKYDPVIYLSHQDFDYKGSWTIFPMLSGLIKEHERDSTCILFCTESTHFNMENLEKTLDKYNFSDNLFVGHALVDTDPSILHHYAYFEKFNFSYPNFGTGFFISMTLIKQLSKICFEDGLLLEASMDASHELALFIYNHFGVHLLNESSFCIFKNEDCVTYVEQFQPCGNLVTLDNIYFAVKTCEQFYDSRIPIVKKTWSKIVENIEYFSHTYDSSIPTVDLKIENTDSGHCAKTIALIHYVANKIEKNQDILWLAIVDDDTIISPKLLAKFLTCFEATENILLGERYGHKAFLTDNSGVNYIAGGGAMILSRQMVFSTVKNNTCQCPNDDYPDDIYLGKCAEKIGGKIIHSSKFHTARPLDYSENYLLTDGAISFHKYWLVDPLKVYKDWFSKYDNENISYLDFVIKKVTNMVLCYFKMCKLCYLIQ